MRNISGAGVGWRPPIADLIANRCEQLGFVEIVAENHLPTRLDLRLTALQLPVIPHGVTLGLAGAERPDGARLRRLGDLAEAFGSPLVSEHVAFVRAATTPDTMHGDVLEAGHLMPPPRTRQCLDVLVENITISQEHLPVPLAVENIAAMVTWPEDEFDEPDFLTELVDRTGVRLVLDVANLYASALARHTDPFLDLQRMPLPAVAYVHVAGGEFRDGLYFDSHGADVVEPVADLLAALVELCPSAAVMLERDADISEETVGPELDRLLSALIASRTAEVAR